MFTNQQRGSALITVLWLSMILVLITSSMSNQQRTALAITHQHLSQLQARYGLIAAEQWLQYQLLDANPNQPPPLSQYWQYGPLQVRLHIQPEDDRINLNLAQPQTLIALFAALGHPDIYPSVLADRIIDWRDPDNLPRLHGAEAPHYRQRGLLPPANRPFNHLSELQQVDGINQSLMQQLRPWLSLHSRNGRYLPEALQARALQTEPPLQSQPAPAGIHRSPSWHLQLEAYQQGQFLQALDTVIRKKGIVTAARPYSTLSWQPSRFPLLFDGGPDVTRHQSIP
ncbi:MAG: type II secretion system protein GspK [Marinobacterium sp.]|nr:type II secretion system protein GspK [Marinobacterium sp.]